MVNSLHYISPLKGLEHRVSFGSESTYLKCYWYVSLNQEMSCWTSDPWKYYDNILNTCQMHEHWGKPTVCLMDKKMVSVHFNGVLENILVCVHLYIFIKTSKCYIMSMVNQAGFRYLESFRLFPVLCPYWALVALMFHWTCDCIAWRHRRVYRARPQLCLARQLFELYRGLLLHV